MRVSKPIPERPTMTKLNPTPDGVVLVGIDIAKIRNEVLIEVADNARRRRLSVLNIRAEHDRFIALLKAYGKPVICAFEVTGSYHRPLGWQTDKRSFRHKQPTAFGLPGRDIQPLAPPDPLDPLVIDDPARRATQQLDDLAIAKAAVLAGEFDEVGRELRLVVAAPRDLSLGRAMLRKHAADPPLGQLQLTTNMLGAGQAARGAQKFPRAASFRMSLSSVRSDSARQSRLFCASNSFSCFTWSSLSPPNSWRQR
jgi:hypothetical protein